MSEQFDAYHVWLGIPPEEQPPDCYRLLGIPLFESRPEVIEHAADQRMAHLKSLGAGPHAALCQKILNQVAGARVRLLDPRKKAIYDERLREELQVGPASPPVRPEPGRRLGLSEAEPQPKQATPLTHPTQQQAGAAPQPTSPEPPSSLAPQPSPLAPVPSFELPTTTYAPLGKLGEYLLLEKIGEGGMGTVYKALHSKLGRLVALKVLPKDRRWDERAVARFDREMKAVGAVDHPNIVRAMDAREVEGTRFLVMEYVEGLDLNALGRACHPIAIADACEIIRQAALGLEDVHRHHLVHRDVKPSNLMVTRPRGHQGGQAPSSPQAASAPPRQPAGGKASDPLPVCVKLLDLGLARFQYEHAVDEEVTGTGMAMGTVDYMAPEQVTDAHSVDIRADVYGLGCTLYKLLAGRTPFSGSKYKTAMDKMAAHVRDAVPPIRKHRPDAPAELVRLLDRMLAKDRRKRFSTPAEVADALGPLAAGSDLAALVAKGTGSYFAAAGGGRAKNVPVPLEAPREEAALLDKQAVPPAAASVEEPEDTRSSSSLTRFLREIVGGEGTSTVRRRAEKPWSWKKLAAVGGFLVVAAASMVAVLIWGLMSQSGLPAEGKLVFDLSEAERREVTLSVDRRMVPSRDAGPLVHRVPPGEHTISASRDGYHSIEQQVKLKPGEERKHTPFDWKQLPNLVLVWPKAERQWSTLEIDGQQQDIEKLAMLSTAGSVETRLPAGEHKIAIRRPGVKTFQKTVKVEAKKECKIVVVFQPLPNLFLHWAEAERKDATLEIDGKRQDIEALATDSIAGRLDLTVEPGDRKVSIKRPGYEAFEKVEKVEAGKDCTISVVLVPHKPPVIAKPVPPKPPEEDERLKRYRELAKRWKEAMEPVESLAAAWDFVGALKEAEKVQFDEKELTARLAARREELGRMAAFKARIIEKINAADPPLKKSALAIRGQNGDVTGASDEGISTKLPLGKIELIPWSDVGTKAPQRLIELALDQKSADDRLVAGLVALACNQPALAEKHFDAARALGVNIDAYLAPLAEAALARARELLEAKDFEKADAALADLESKYAHLPWFAAMKPTVAAGREAAKAGILKNQEAETLYAEAVRLFRKKELFDVKALVEKLKSDYADTEVVRSRGRRPSLAEMEKAVAGVPKPITVRLDGKGQFKGIQAAIDAAPSKSLIEIEDNGPYHEKVTIPKDKYELRVRGKKGCWPVITSADLPPGPRPLVTVEGSGAFLERLVLLDGVLSVSAGDVRLRWLIIHGSIATGGYQRKCECEECLVTTGASAGAPTVFRNCLFLGSAEAGHELYLRVNGSEAQRCVILSQLGLSGHPSVRPRACDSILCRPPPQNEAIGDIENCALLAGDLPEQSRGCFKADPMFVDPKNFDYRPKRGSPCIGKASDGGDIGCRYTPEMIELCKVALDLRRKGILKF